MEKSKIGGKGALGSASSPLQPQKLITSSTLQKAKESALKSKERMRHRKAASGQFIVQVKVPIVKVGTARMLTKPEIEELRQTKQSIARHMQGLKSA